jgi:hypothetical protein
MARKQSTLDKFGHLPRLVESNDDGKQRQKVNGHKDHYKTLSTTDLATEYTKLRDEKDDIEEEIKVLNARITAISELMIEKFEGEEISAIRTQAGYLVSSKYDPYASVKDKEAFITWVKENGYENLLTIQWQTMNSITKELLENGMAPPDGVEVFLKPGLRLSRG